MTISFLQRLASILRRNRSYVYECRKCGTTVPNEDSTCPYCDQTEILVYDVT
jgi:rubrerythrin